MTYFLRFTTTATEDLERATSLHMSDFSPSEIEISKIAEMFDCIEDSIIEYEGLYCQKLDGLCGYELESDNIDDAIVEVEEGNFQFSSIGAAVIFLGTGSSETDLVPDGDLFYPQSIEIILN